MDWKEESISCMDAWEEAAVLIAQEIRDWSEQILEVPSDAFAGLPPCPFARKAWFAERVMIHVCADLDAVVEIKALYPPTDHMTHVVAVTGWDEYSVEEFDAWVNDQNANHFGVWIMGFHPEADEDENVPEFEGNGADDYAVLIVQSLTHIADASDQIRNTGYYDGYSVSDMQMINEREEQAHAWKKQIVAEEGFDS